MVRDVKVYSEDRGIEVVYKNVYDIEVIDGAFILRMAGETYLDEETATYRFDNGWDYKEL